VHKLELYPIWNRKQSGMCTIWNGMQPAMCVIWNASRYIPLAEFQTKAEVAIEKVGSGLSHTSSRNCPQCRITSRHVTSRRVASRHMRSCPSQTFGIACWISCSPHWAALCHLAPPGCTGSRRIRGSIDPIRHNIRRVRGKASAAPDTDRRTVCDVKFGSFPCASSY
jgi:hypothetical protein